MVIRISEHILIIIIVMMMMMMIIKEKRDYNDWKLASFIVEAHLQCSHESLITKL